MSSKLGYNSAAGDLLTSQDKFCWLLHLANKRLKRSYSCWPCWVRWLDNLEIRLNSAKLKLEHSGAWQYFVEGEVDIGTVDFPIALSVSDFSFHQVSSWFTIQKVFVVFMLVLKGLFLTWLLS